MATAKKITEVAVLEEAGKVTTNAADSDEGLSFSLVNFRNPDPFLNTPGLSTGEPISSGRFTGATVKGLFGIPLGCIIELEHGGRVVTLLNTGEYSGVLK